MLDLLRGIQPLLLAVVLLLSATTKTADRAGRGQGPAVLLPQRLRRPATVASSGVEALLAAGLLLLPGMAGDVVRAATAVWFAGAALALLRLRRRAPDQGCGCFGGVSTTPVGWRTIARAALFAGAAAAAVGADPSGITAGGGAAVAAGTVTAAEVAVLAALSPELTELTARLRRRAPCEVREVPLRRTMSRLRSSEVWQANAASLAERRPHDVWRQGCWRLLRFSGSRGGRPVDVVFGVPVGGHRAAVRAVVSDADTGATLAVLGELADRGPTLPRERGVPRSTGTVTLAHPRLQRLAREVPRPRGMRAAGVRVGRGSRSGRQDRAGEGAS
ncbi:hypothetical protein FHX37_3560 [Haloactinospora alba]|uniref:Methylamine utilisation protein MauE domain-containing protein n=1 Tax=Haloactinospora alba TaxID=405555 RepID=A0A543NNW0_9ACTN|nr:MauE/DoxX family redox-associated membrane protein [Haloactinospora alba]TQN33538.1 hypothetical protein FHX37_3560 [Haloactinospora alba]